MRIKTKLNLGIGLLFALIILLALFSIEQISSLSSASENIIKDNKETVAYTRNMLKALSEIVRGMVGCLSTEKYNNAKNVCQTELRTLLTYNPI